MKDWRPIALCNVLYKLLPKILVNRLKKVLHKYIVDSQSTFVPGRSILDNALVAIELVHYMKTKKRGNEKSVALKLDISKVYDMIEWSYLRDVMCKMGFHYEWDECWGRMGFKLVLNVVDKEEGEMRMIHPNHIMVQQLLNLLTRLCIAHKLTSWLMEIS